MKICHTHYIPNNKMLAINRIIHGMRSEGMLSVPVKYNATHTGHKSAAFKKPNVVKAKAICPTGGSPITFLNMTYVKCKY